MRNVSRLRPFVAVATSAFLWLVSGGPVSAQQLDVERVFEERNLEPVAGLLAQGEYELCARICEVAIGRGFEAPEWRSIRVRALMELGREVEARDVVELAVKTFPANFELLMLQHDNALRIGRRDIATAALNAINAAARAKPAKDRTAADWTALGRAALALGADAKKVIEQYFSVAQKKDPKLEAAYLAEGHLALTKDDAKRAADVFRAGLKAHGETANLRVGLALAFKNGDREKMAENLVRALEANPAHSGAHLARAELLIGAERFTEAELAIQRVLDVRENCPEAWALRSAIARLNSPDASKAETARASGFQRWDRNPEVDHIIGRVLSRAYRFGEGAPHQRRALEFAPDYLPARVQLCHDLLRLGEEDEAWKLANAIRAADGYNVQAHNIGLLENEMADYTTQSFGDFTIKMPKRDWPIYGERALELLREAKAVLAPKYGLELRRPVLVEFFGSQQDFAIRTFGSLGGQGLLGVCFGTVITMNSPGSLAHGRNNWESTLWHEFCHVITLSLTQNKMPRWLSEGISVHEESQRDPAWGMPMNVQFRRMILDDGDLTPVGQLTSAFLSPESDEHLMFAYFQSSQVVSYLLERHGVEKFQAVLRDLAHGTRINDALTANTEPLDQLEAGFKSYITAKAQAFGAAADWHKPEPEEVNPLDPASFAEYLARHPTNIWAAHKHAADLLEAKDWQRALAAADTVIQLVPEDFGADSGYQMKAAALRALNRTDEEAAVLRQISAGEPGALPIFLRLIELDLPRQDWPQILSNARRALALNPFLRGPRQALAEAAQAQGLIAEAVAAFQRLLIVDPDGATMTHFRLAKLLRETDSAAAKRHLLDSLALAPRFREGLRLLRELPR